MSLVFAGIVSHAPGITGRARMADAGIAGEFHGAFRSMGERLAEARPDALVVVTAEHFANFFMNNMPAFAVGMADQYEGPIEDPAWLGIARTKVPGDANLSLRMIREIITLMVGPGNKDRQKLCFTVPAAPLGAQESLTYHEATLRQILSELGYQPASINEGLAVIYSELESSNYTGIGISLGGGLCNVCLAYLSVPVLSFSIPKAGDFIDSSAASVTGERANRIRLTKEDSFHFNGFFADKIHQVIGVYYDDMIRALVGALKVAFARAKDLPKFNRPIPMILSGGTAMPPGFRERFDKLLWEQDFPITISDIRLAQNPLHATAKGALVYALSDL